MILSKLSLFQSVTQIRVISVPNQLHFSYVIIQTLGSNSQTLFSFNRQLDNKMVSSKYFDFSFRVLALSVRHVYYPQGNISAVERQA